MPRNSGRTLTPWLLIVPSLALALFVIGGLQVSFAENIGNSPSVHALHGLLALVVTAALTTDLTALLLLLASGVALIPLSCLEFRRFALRAWLVVPVFTLLIALPATTRCASPPPSRSACCSR